MLKLIAFDFDGTIADTIPLCIEAFRSALLPYVGYSLSDQEILQTFGLNEAGIIRNLAGERWEEALEEYYCFYDAIHDICQAPFPGMIELLDFLKNQGIPIALITGKAKRSCDISLKKLQLFDYFVSIQTGSAERHNKDELLRNLMTEYRLAHDELVYIGDAVVDAESCHQVNVRCLSAAWSPTVCVNDLQKVNPGFVFTDLKQLKAYLFKHLEQK